MHIGLISDVHANAPALRAVLDDGGDIDQWIHAGDVVGYGPYPKEAIDILRSRGIRSIQGNHDRGAIGDFHEGFTGLPRTIIEWTAEHLDADDLAYIKSLPIEMELFDGRVHVAHGRPAEPNTYVYPEEFDASLLSGEAVLVLGHTHKQALGEFDGGTVVNPGSVGQPRDGNWRSGYAVLDLDTMEVNLRRVEYPYERVQQESREHGFPAKLVDAYETGEIVPAKRAERSG